MQHSHQLSNVISAIGESAFGTSFLALIREYYDADHCAIFLLSGTAPMEIASSSFDGTDTAHLRTRKYIDMNFWKRDPSMSEAWLHASATIPRFIQCNVGGLADNDLRTHIYPHVAERVLLYGQTDGASIALSMVKAEESLPLSSEAMDEFRHSAPLLLSILGKHTALVLQKANLRNALTSLADIEAVILSCNEHFPRREAQVCARILYGIYTAGIALELGISEETVTTYRKRIYLRLGIGTQRELTLWYIRRWSETGKSPRPALRCLPH